MSLVSLHSYFPPTGIPSVLYKYIRIVVTLLLPTEISRSAHLTLVVCLFVQADHDGHQKREIDSRRDGQVIRLVVEYNLPHVQELAVYPGDRRSVARNLRAPVEEAPDDLELHGVAVVKVLEVHRHLRLEQGEVALDVRDGLGADGRAGVDVKLAEDGEDLVGDGEDGVALVVGHGFLVAEGEDLAVDLEEHLSVGGGDLKVVPGEGDDALAELHGELGAMVRPLLEATDRHAIETHKRTLRHREDLFSGLCGLASGLKDADS